MEMVVGTFARMLAVYLVGLVQLGCLRQSSLQCPCNLTPLDCDLTPRVLSRHVSSDNPG